MGVKFELIGKHKRTGEIIRQTFTIDELIDYESKWIKQDYEIVGKRQFIGRKARNNKGIYEGDIIEAEIIEHDSLATTGVVTYSEDLLCWCSKNHAGMTPLFKLGNFNVVSDTYEKPDILTV